MAKPNRFRNFFVVATAFFSGIYLRRSQPQVRSLKGIDQAFVAKLPRRPALVSGVPSEPNNLLLIGSAEQLQAAFKRAGWFGTLEPSLWRLILSAFAMLFSIGYRRGPVTPYFLDERLQDLSFQKPTRGRSFRHRHHIRIWHTGRKLTQGDIWIAAASYDQGVRFTFHMPLITHQISPNLDGERDFVVSDLAKDGQAVASFDFNHQTVGQNAFGDNYQTDGRIKVVEV